MLHLIKIKHPKVKPKNSRGKGHISVHHKIEMKFFSNNFLNM